jgi:hypothetical protein
MSPLNLFGSLLRQFVQRCSEIPDDVIKFYKDHESSKERPLLVTYFVFLTRHLKTLSKSFLVIDGLDEMLGGSIAINEFLSEVQQLKPTIRLLVTSRSHITHIARMFKDAAQFNICARDEDIRIYLQNRIEQEVHLKNVIQTDQTLQDSIINIILDKSERRFAPLLKLRI